MKKMFLLIASSVMLASCGNQVVPQAESSTSTQSQTHSQAQPQKELTQAEVDTVNKIWAMSPERTREVSEQLAVVPQDKQEAALHEILKSEPASLGSQAYPGGLTAAEARICASSLFNCWKTKDIAEYAKARAAINFPDGGWLGRQDAFRHAYWNAVMRAEISLTWATNWANAHESETPASNDKQMDLSNNATGRRLPGSSRSALETATRNAVLNGGLVCLNARNINAGFRRTGYSPCF